MSALVFVMARGQNAFFAELVGAIRDELDALGVESRVSLDGYPDPEPDTAYVLVPPHEWIALSRLVGEPDRSLFPRTVFLCAEQPGTSHFEENVALAETAAAVLDINRFGVREYERRGIDAEHFQLGWSARWEAARRPSARDVDVLFLGCESERRRRYLSAYGNLMWRWRTRFVVSDNSRPNSEMSSSFVTGAEKLALLSRARVMLNVHQGEAPYFEWLRVVEAISNGCVVVSEHSADFSPLAPGEHLLLGHASTLGMLAQQLLEDEETRSEIAASAYGFLRAELPLRRAAERLADLASDAAGAPIRSVAGARFVLPVEAVPVEPDGPQPPNMTDDPAVSSLKAGMKEIQLDLVDLRRGLARDRMLAATGRAPRELVLDAWSPVWSSATARVSVLTTVYNYGHHIEAALDSVATCGYRDLEIVVVDDGSSDDSRERVRQWIARNSHVPALLISRPLNRGLPWARNAALGFARGEHCFVLDADNEVYPGSVARLVHALDSDPAAAFAYGVLERFDTQGPIDVIGYQPWEPDRLRTGNYIDAMALIRTSTLREVGGYVTDRRLHGWEDYDLWCRIAESGGHGVHVPEVIARYRVSRHSMLSLTNLSATVAFSVLIERHPRLMAGVRPPL